MKKERKTCDHFALWNAKEENALKSETSENIKQIKRKNLIYSDKIKSISKPKH